MLNIRIASVCNVKKMTDAFLITSTQVQATQEYAELGFPSHKYYRGRGKILFVHLLLVLAIAIHKAYINFDLIIFCLYKNHNVYECCLG